MNDYLGKDVGHNIWSFMGWNGQRWFKSLSLEEQSMSWIATKGMLEDFKTLCLSGPRKEHAWEHVRGPLLLYSFRTFIEDSVRRRTYD